MQVAFYKSSNQLRVFLTKKEARRLDPNKNGVFQASVVPAGPSTFRITVTAEATGNPLREVGAELYSVAWTTKSTSQSGVNLLRPRSQAAVNVGSISWGADGSLSGEISYDEAETAAGVPALMAPSTGIKPAVLTTKAVSSTDELGTILAQMKAHGIRGRVTAITVEVE